MEGPSLIIAAEEFRPFVGRRVAAPGGSLASKFQDLKGKKFTGARSWGKHFLLAFENATLRIHFLMFGSYRINTQRENRIPKLVLSFAADQNVYFYSCAIKALTTDVDSLYDWSVDVMSKKWNSRKALSKVSGKKESEVCDVLMDQEIFSGVGNIIKNEVLYALKLHPEAKVKSLSGTQTAQLVKEVRSYCRKFYKWKKAGELKRNWLVFRKKNCPKGHAVTKKNTGVGNRVSHFCKICQPNKISRTKSA